VTASRPKGWSNALSLPAFQDPRLDDVARLVYWISVVLPVAAAVFALMVLAFARERIAGMVFVVLIIWAVSAAAIALLRSKRPVPAARLVVVGVWLISTAFMLLTGGVSSPAVVGPLFSVALAGILLGERACIAMAAVVSATAFGAAWAQQAFGLGFATPLATPWLRAGFVGAYAAAVGVLQVVTFRNLSAAVDIARQANEGLAAAGKVYDTTSEGIVVTDADGLIVDANDAYARMHGYELGELIGKNPRLMKSGKHDPAFYSEMWGSLVKEGRWQGEVWNRRSDGGLLPTWLSLSAVKDEAGLTTNYVGVVSDITAIKRGEEDLQWLATHDPLTGLPNRALIEDRLNTVLALSRRQDSNAAVFFFDLDHFKNVNDTLGHPAGDRLLIEIANRCRSVVRESDTIGRSGGDEFSVVVPDLSDVEYVAELAQRLLAVVREPVALGEQATFVTASIGVAVYPEDGSDAAELNQHADVAMYRAKALGGDRFELFSAELQRELHQRVEIEAGLRMALNEDRLFLVYQPQVELSTGRIVGMEALVRWRDVDGSVIMPDRFIPVAESSGLIVDVGAAVLRQACVDLRLLSDEGHDHLTMAMNISAREWMEQDVAAIVVGAISGAGLRPAAFEIEITESSIVTRTDVVAAKVRSLQEQGVCVSIDDFGTGYASMAYVMDFHPSKLKIDRSFVWALPHDPSARAIVNATIALADGIGARVLAEGPETKEQVRYLRDRGCDLAQGFYFSGGIPLDELRQLLQEGPFSVPDAAEVGSPT